MTELEQRIEKVEHIMFGNGEEGALEVMRGVKKDVGELKRQIDEDLKPKVEALDRLFWKLSGGFAAIVAGIQLVSAALGSLL